MCLGYKDKSKVAHVKYINKYIKIDQKKGNDLIHFFIRTFIHIHIRGYNTYKNITKYTMVIQLEILWDMFYTCSHFKIYSLHLFTYKDKFSTLVPILGYILYMCSHIWIYSLHLFTCLDIFSSLAHMFE